MKSIPSSTSFELLSTMKMNACFIFWFCCLEVIDWIGKLFVMSELDICNVITIMLSCFHNNDDNDLFHKQQEISWCWMLFLLFSFIDACANQLWSKSCVSEKSVLCVEQSAAVAQQLQVEQFGISFFSQRTFKCCKLQISFAWGSFWWTRWQFSFFLCFSCFSYLLLIQMSLSDFWGCCAVAVSLHHLLRIIQKAPIICVFDTMFTKNPSWKACISCRMMNHLHHTRKCGNIKMEIDFSAN